MVLVALSKDIWCPSGHAGSKDLFMGKNKKDPAKNADQKRLKNPADGAIHF
jgi:hypothetical protein